MRKTSLMDRELFRIAQELVAAITEFSAGDSSQIEFFVEMGSVAGIEQLFYHLSYTVREANSSSEKIVETAVMDDRIHRSCNSLLVYFTRNGSAFPGFRILLERQSTEHWKNDFMRLDTAQGSQLQSPIQKPLIRP